ncbi:MAG TPA: helix-turn-helix domain-containing protein [Calditerricola sp.]
MKDDPLSELVTGADIARRLGITRQRVYALMRRPDFPRPVGRLSRYWVWRWRDVEEWVRRRRKRAG